MRLVTNLQRFPAESTVAGVQMRATVVPNRFEAFVRALPRADWLLVNGRPEILLRLIALGIACPPLRRPLVSVDLVLRVPSSPLAGWAKRALFSRVDWFLHYFRDLDGYERHYGIGPERCGYVPFKPNIAGRFDCDALPDGRYVLCFGRSLRDYDTFFAAMERLPHIPGAIPSPDFACLRAHGSRFTRPLDRLPANVEILPDDGSDEAMFRLLRGALVVALPILPSSICASGIGSYLNAMRMRRCVIVSEGPGASDVLADQALIVPPSDPEALARTIRRAVEERALRERVAEAGYRYACALGTEADSHRRIVEAALHGLRMRGRLDGFSNSARAAVSDSSHLVYRRR